MRSLASRQLQLRLHQPSKRSRTEAELEAASSSLASWDFAPPQLVDFRISIQLIRRDLFALGWTEPTQLNYCPARMSEESIFAVGATVRIKSDPGSVGVFAGSTRQQGPILKLKVVFPTGTRWVPQDQLEAEAEQANILDDLRSGRFGTAADLRPPSGSATGGKGGKRCLWQNRACRVERLLGK